MVSDGAFTGEERWLENLIKSYEDGTCQDLAKKVVEEAIKRRNDGHDDDVTAVVLKLHNDK
jgi:stage II sporulation protein E